jgi:hypothetical protein
MSSLLTPVYSTSIIDSIINEINLNTSSYYVFVGKATDWEDETTPPTPINNEYNFREVRKSSVFYKKIIPSEASYLIPRIDWTANTVYDMYDDRYGTEIIGVNITSGGANYSNLTANAVITGNGSNANVSVVVSDGAISKVIVNNPGIGYTTANVAFYGDPGSGATGTVVLAASSTNKTNLKECLFYVLTDDFHVYKCLDNNNGVASNTKPSLTTTDPFTTADGYKWKFLYKIPDALRNRFLTANYIPVLNSTNSNFYSNGSILSAAVQASGSGYTAANTSIQVTGDGYQDGNKLRIVSANILVSGDSFTTANVTVEPPYSSVAWSATTAVSAGTRVNHANNIYLATITGTTGSTGPVHTSGIVLNGSVRLKFLGNTARIQANVVSNAITSVGLLNPGYGYFFTPNVTITGGANANIIVQTVQTSANLQPVIVGGQITGVQIVDGGIGYTYASANVVGDGAGGRVIVDLSTRGIDTLQTTVEQLAVDGAIYAIKMISNGYGYTTANVTITGDGVGANATATVSNGRVTRINITDPGSGYSDAEIIITGNGKGASARAIIPPNGGHGVNAIRELFASKLGLSTELYKIENKGFTTANDYRRLGIVKNIKDYNNTEFYKKLSGSACWLITGTFSSGSFPIDTQLIQTSTGGLFTVIEVEDNRMLVQMVNSIEPEIGATITDNTTSFVVASVEKPDVDFYSGDLLYIVNKEAFDVTGDQLVTIKTVLGF